MNNRKNGIVSTQQAAASAAGEMSLSCAGEDIALSSRVTHDLKRPFDPERRAAYGRMLTSALDAFDEEFAKRNA